MINGATCNGTTHVGCSHLAATAKVGHVPFAVAVDDLTHTIYVTNDGRGELPRTVSVLNTATCNGTVTTGCGGPITTMATGRLPPTLAIDTRTGIVYVAEANIAAVGLLNGSHCRTGDTSGCAAALQNPALTLQTAALSPRRLQTCPCAFHVRSSSARMPRHRLT